MSKFIKRLFCDHEWKKYSFSDVECKKCGKKKYDPALALKLINNYCTKMVDAGHWNEQETSKLQFSHGLQ